MRRTIMLASGALALLMVAGLGQDRGQDLSALLLSQDQVRLALEDDTWVLSSASTLAQNPPGAESATAIYENPRHTASTILLDFVKADSPESPLIVNFLQGSIEARRPKLKPDTEPKDLLEALNAEREQKADFALLFELEDDTRQLLFRRGLIVVFWQSDLGEAELVKLAQAHLDHLAEQGR